jgi:hypothetical protein
MALKFNPFTGKLDYTGAGGGGGGAPVNASYVVMSNDGTLTDERVLTQGSNIDITDGGANGPVTIATVADPTFDLVEFDSTYTSGVSQYQMAWNADEETVDIGLAHSSTLHIGQQSLYHVENGTASAINKGTLVVFAGTVGSSGKLRIAPHTTNIPPTAIMGITASDIAAGVGSEGYVAHFGKVRGIDASGTPYGEVWNDGDVLYADPAGGLTNVAPTAPIITVAAVVSNNASNGTLFVRPSFGQTSQEVGVDVGPVDNAVLRADVGTGIVQNSGLIVEDTIVSVTGITGDAGTDVITAPGTAFANGQPIRFTALTGGTGLNTTTNYFVVNPVGATFQVETSIGGGAINFTTNITAGTLLTGHSVQANVTLSENTTETNSALVLTPKGTGALIAQKPDGATSGGNARGTKAVDWQMTRNLATQVASGSHSVICGGTQNTATGGSEDVGSVVVGGKGNGATGNYGAFIGAGFNNTASGLGSFVGSGLSNTASAIYATVANGHQTVADRAGMHAHAHGRFAANGDAQRARFVLRNKTTTNAAVELFLDGSSTRLTIPSGKIFAFTINISGVKSDGSAVAHYLRQYCLKHISGTTSEVYAPVTIGSDNAAGTSIALSANDTNDALKVEVTGIAAETWRWVASVDAVEITAGA